MDTVETKDTMNSSQENDECVVIETTDSAPSVQINTEIITAFANQLLSVCQAEKEKPMSEDEKKKAAYALNLCTVSVSQIIDYNDIKFLEYEYDAILNNLNLEQIPKDEALLHILKQLLDVITFFRIQEGEKKMLEKEYQQKMKNAIWNAVPNFGVIASGNPVALAVSLASQVGIGYMNYRKEKAQIGLEQERKEWELQRSAMEQFNGLQRELFDTAWRLAEKYKFNDKYRLTERQITQYNRILMDADDLRRYERLNYIKEKFEAYPPFWYYLGSAANAVHQNSDKYTDLATEDYKEIATEQFRKFISLTDGNLLREDQLRASCALELFDLLDNTNRKEKSDLLSKAIDAAGNAYDVLQLCALSYLNIQETEEGIKLLRMLVNENYNTDMNAKLLSRLYVQNILDNQNVTSNRQDYLSLAARVGTDALFPLPQNDIDLNILGDNYIGKQQLFLKERYSDAIKLYISQYAKRYDLLCKQNGDISVKMVNLLNEMTNLIQIIMPDENSFETPLYKMIKTKVVSFRTMLRCEDQNDRYSKRMAFTEITKPAFEALTASLNGWIYSLGSMQLINEAESRIDVFYEKMSNSNENYHGQHQYVSTSSDIFAQLILEENIEDQNAKMLKRDNCLQIVKNYVKSLVKKGNDSEIIFIRGDYAFAKYLDGHGSIVNNISAQYKRVLPNAASIICIIRDKNRNILKSTWDLVLTTEGVVVLEHQKIKRSSTYQHITFFGKKEMKIGAVSYSKDFLNMGKFIEMIGELAGKQESNANDLLDIIDENMLGKSLVRASSTYRRPQKSAVNLHDKKQKASPRKRTSFFGKKDK